MIRFVLPLLALMTCTAHAQPADLGDVEKIFDEAKEHIITGQNPKSWKPLHYAAHHDIPSVVNVLLITGAEVDATNEVKHTALHEAAFMDNIDVIELLLKEGANKNALDAFGRKPAYYAGSKEAKQLLK